MRVEVMVSICISVRAREDKYYFSLAAIYQSNKRSNDAFGHWIKFSNKHNEMDQWSTMFYVRLVTSNKKDEQRENYLINMELDKRGCQEEKIPDNSLQFT
tara:strand:- start:274 stop:573 length:300 start_codon:yes stop_codon:yes gene_type:complete